MRVQMVLRLGRPLVRRARGADSTTLMAAYTVTSHPVAVSEECRPDEIDWSRPMGKLSVVT
jgi:hypothetical protein